MTKKNDIVYVTISGLNTSTYGVVSMGSYNLGSILPDGYKPVRVTNIPVVFKENICLRLQFNTDGAVSILNRGNSATSALAEGVGSGFYQV